MKWPSGVAALRHYSTKSEPLKTTFVPRSGNSRRIRPFLCARSRTLGLRGAQQMAFPETNGYMSALWWLESKYLPGRGTRGCEGIIFRARSEEHTSELQSRQYLVCRLLLEKKKYTLS